MKKRINKYLVLSFIIPFFILLLLAIIKNVVFGNNGVLISDLKVQYVSLLEYYRGIFTSGNSIFYSFSKGIGGNMIGTFAYYMASPLNLFLLLFNEKTLPTGIALLISIKISLSGLSMFSFLKKEFKMDNVVTLLFSISYALMAYNINYYFNIMWLDAVYLLPIILIGIGKIVDNKSSLLYGLSLFIAIFTNYYIGYMICIFSVIYFIYKLVNKNLKKRDDILKIIIKFSVSSILAGLMAFIIIYPAFLELKKGTLTENLFSFNGLDNSFDFIKIFAHSLIGSSDYLNILNAGVAHTYVGMIAMPLIYFFFINKNVSKKEKIIDGAVLLILISGLFIPAVNLIWHGFTFPNGFNYRYAFIISLFLIYIACKSFKNLKFVDLKYYLYFIILFCIMGIMTVFRNFSFITYGDIYISLGLVIIYMILLYNVNNKTYEKKKNVILVLLLAMVASELFFNAFDVLRDFDISYNDEYLGHAITFKDEIKNKEGSEFYRIEKDISYTYLDSMLQDYNGVSMFVTSVNRDVIKLFNNLGTNVMERSLFYNPSSTEISDSLLGIKYFYYIKNIKNNYNIVDIFKFNRGKGLYFDILKTNVNVYENPYSLSLGYMSKNDTKEFVDKFVNSGRYDNFGFQDMMLKTLTGNYSDVLLPIDIEMKENYTYVLKNVPNGNFYINIPIDSLKSKDYIDIYLEDKLIYEYRTDDYGLILTKNDYGKSDLNLKLKYSSSKKTFGYPIAAYLNQAVFEKDIEYLKQNQLILKTQTGNHLSGTVSVTKDKTVMSTSIPYEEGWTILVDGKKVDYYKIFDSLIGFDLTEGNHTIDMKYISPGFNLGFLISILSLLLFIIYIFMEEKILSLIISIYNKFEEIINYLIVGVLTTLVSVATYYLFAKVLHINYISSTILSWILSILFAYITNRIFVFKSKTKDKEKVFKEIYGFFKYRIVSLGIELGIMILLVNFLLINDMIAKMFTQVVVIILNYVFSKLFVFKKE